MLNPNRDSLEFRPQKGIRVLLVVAWILLSLIFAGITYGFQTEVYGPEEQYLMNYWYIVLSVLFLLSAVFVFNFCSKIILIDEKLMTHRSLFKTKLLPLDQIKGVRNIAVMHGSGVYDRIKPKFIVKVESEYKNISTFQNRKLRDWAAENFIDLDQADYVKEVAEIRADESLGTTVEERDKKIGQAKMIQDGIVVSGGLLLFVTVLTELPQTIGLTYIAISSALILLGLIYYKGLIRMEWGTARVGMSIPVLMIVFVYAITFKSIGIVSLPRPEVGTKFINMAIGLITITAVYIVLLVRPANYKFKKIWMTLLLFAILIFINESTLNVLLDRSEPKSYITTIREYKITSYRGMSYSYQMRLALWGKEGGIFNNVGVSEETYTTLAPGTHVDIREYEGAFGQKWFIALYNGEELNASKSYFGSANEKVSWGREDHKVSIKKIPE